MPVLNSQGHVLAGVGGGTVSIDGVALDSGGGGVWLTDNVALYQCAAGWYLRSYDQTTLQFTKVDARGANFLIGGGGRWQALLNGQSFGSLGDHPNWNVLDAGSDGTLAICPSYSTGLGFELHAPGGGICAAPTGTPCYGLRVLGPTDALYIGGTGSAGPVVTWSGRSFKQHAPNVRQPKLITLNGEDWLAYYADDLGPVIHPALPAGSSEPLMGYVLANSYAAFNFDVCALNGGIRCCWSLTQGEEPQNVKWADTPLSQTRVNLDPSTVHPPNPGPPGPTPIPPGPDPVIPSFGRHIGFAFYYRDTYAYPQLVYVNGQPTIETQGPGCPGNMALVVTGEARAAVVAAPYVDAMVIGEDGLRGLALVPANWAKVKGIYVTNETGADQFAGIKTLMASVRHTCEDMGVVCPPFITYTQDKTKEAVDAWGDDPNVIIGVQLYVTGNQGPDDLRTLAAQQQAITGACPVCLNAQAYDRTTGNPPAPTYHGDLAALVPVYADIVRGWPQVQYVWPFSYYRKGGAYDHPEIIPWWRAFARACTE